jgi:hypothetical protein
MLHSGQLLNEISTILLQLGHLFPMLSCHPLVVVVLAGFIVSLQQEQTIEFGAIGALQFGHFASTIPGLLPICPFSIFVNLKLHR